tara:strand:- start:191 stop:1576 length:1386 start_codon:yes stop_codon:yes gene_type:complete
MVAVHTPWDKLRACLVGRTYPPEFYNNIKNPKIREPLQRVARETEEDYQKLIAKLKEFDVEVIRLDLSDNIDDYSDNGVVNMPPPMCPRDFSMMVGNTFYMPGPNWGENFNVNHLYWDMMNGDENARWRDEVNKLREETLAKYLVDIMQPGRPLTYKESYDMMRNTDYCREYYLSFMQGIDTEELQKVIAAAEMNTIGSIRKFPSNKNFYPWKSVKKWLIEHDVPIVYDQYISGASCWRIGNDLMFNYVNVMNRLNSGSFKKKWKKLFPDYRVTGISQPGHGDGAMCPVCPGLIISISGSSSYKDSFPGWEKVYLPNESWKKVKPFLKMKSKNQGKWWIKGEEDNDDLINYIETWLGDWVTYVEESVFDVNMLSIDEKNIICNGYNKQAFDAFERYGVTPHIINFRHRYFWDGGLHCITTDLWREGDRKDYFPDRKKDMLVLEPNVDKWEEAVKGKGVESI